MKVEMYTFVNFMSACFGMPTKPDFYSATRLTVATQQTFLQVSQSGYANLINGHASLQSPTGK